MDEVVPESLLLVEDGEEVGSEVLDIGSTEISELEEGVVTWISVVGKNGLLATVVETREDAR